jgi:hypothetical protein
MSRFSLATSHSRFVIQNGVRSLPQEHPLCVALRITRRGSFEFDRFPCGKDTFAA